MGELLLKIQERLIPICDSEWIMEEKDLIKEAKQLQKEAKPILEEARKLGYL